MSSPTTIGDLAPKALRSALAAGLRFRVGAFNIAARSTLPSVAEGVAAVYPDYPVLAQDAFIDFAVNITAPFGIRAVLRPQVQFLFDGYQPFKPLPQAQAFPLMEWGLNWCASNHAHQYVISHAAVVEKNGRALIMPGTPGSGKSTLCAALIQRGWRLLSDELTLTDPDTGQVFPLPRPVSLKINPSMSFGSLHRTRYLAPRRMTRSKARWRICVRRNLALRAIPSPPCPPG